MNCAIEAKFHSDGQQEKQSSLNTVNGSKALHISLPICYRHESDSTELIKAISLSITPSILQRLMPATIDDLHSPGSITYFNMSSCLDPGGESYRRKSFSNYILIAIDILVSTNIYLSFVFFFFSIHSCRL